MSAWEQELGDDVDKEFILTGVREGFHIIDQNSSPEEAAANNHPSALPTSPLFAQATEQVNVEILHGNYVEVKAAPLVISPLGVIEKPGEALGLYTIAVALPACLLTTTPLSWINKGFNQWTVQLS